MVAGSIGHSIASYQKILKQNNKQEGTQSWILSYQVKKCNHNHSQKKLK
jgi:hypothetical protein